MMGESILHQRSLPRPLSFRMISGTITAMVVLICPHFLSLSFLLILPSHPPYFHSSSVLETNNASKSNSVWNDGITINNSILSSMPVHPPPHFSHIIPHWLPPLSIHHQFWKLSTHQHQVPPWMNPILLPCRFSLLLFIHIIPHRFSLHRFICIIVPLPSSPPFMPQKMKQVNHQHQIAILHRPTLPPLLVTLILTGVISQRFEHSIHHRSVHSFTSTQSRASPSDSILPSMVKLAAWNYSSTPLTTMSPFQYTMCCWSINIFRSIFLDIKSSNYRNIICSELHQCL